MKSILGKCVLCFVMSFCGILAAGAINRSLLPTPIETVAVEQTSTKALDEDVVTIFIKVKDGQLGQLDEAAMANSIVELIHNSDQFFKGGYRAVDLTAEIRREDGQAPAITGLRVMLSRPKSSSQNLADLLVLTQILPKSLSLSSSH